MRYNEPFYERRIAVPLAGAALYELEGDRSLLDISLVGYLAALLALFLLLLLRTEAAVTYLRAQSERDALGEAQAAGAD